jgi:hypothetical protein
MVAARVAVAIVVVLAAGSAAAEEAPPAPWQRFGFDLGVASAVGLAGVDYQLAPWRWSRLEGAVGWGPTGVQLSIMPKLALGSGSCAFVAGAGASLAIGGQQAMTGPEHEPRPLVIPWLNVDVPGVECRTPSGLSVQATLGFTMPLVDFHWDLADVGATMHAGSILPQGRVGVGWWF